MAMELHRWMERQIASHILTGVEMLVKPLIRRRDHAALVPRTDDFFFAFFPHDRVALAGGNDNRAARAMTVRLLVGLGRENGHVSGQFGIGKLHEHALPTG